VTTKTDSTSVGDGLAPRDPAVGDYSLVVSQDRCPSASGDWRVSVEATGHLVSRRVYNGHKPWPALAEDEHFDQRYQDEVIFPAWPATLQEEIDASATPLADLQTHWDEATGRLRDSAKWMATVIGAALAALIPTAPLTHLSRHITAAPASIGSVGLLFMIVTMVLVLRVMQLQSVDYNEIEGAKPYRGLEGALHLPRRAAGGALYKWKDDIQKHADLYLPIGVNSLIALRRLMIVEEVTLMAIACAEQGAKDPDVLELLSRARTARVARLHELRATAASIVSVGIYYKVQGRSNIATYLGAIFGLLGVIAIIIAVAWPGG
jgi:hypothetical protein